MTNKQESFLQAMLQCSTISKAADMAGISRTTATKYLRNPEFQAELTRRRGECINDTVRFLQGKLALCSETLIGIIENPLAADQVKINAINAIFTNCKAMTETAEIVTRLEQLERYMEEEDAE